MVAEPPDRRELILTSAGELFARKGIGATTVREIADAVGVLSGSLYHHFNSKDAIVDEVLTGYLEALSGRYAIVLASDAPPRERLYDLVIASLEIAEQHTNATMIYQNESHYLREQPRFDRIKTLAADVQRTWLTVIEAGVADGSFRDDIEPRVFYRLIRDAVWLSVRWHRPHGSYSAKKLADDVTSVFLDGFAAGAVRSVKAPAKSAARG